MLSKETTYSQARMNLASILDQVCDEHQIIVIKRRNQKNVALIAEDELSSLLECVYLLRSRRDLPSAVRQKMPNAYFGL